jgi:Endonuclease NucS N-terminal PH-like domain
LTASGWGQQVQGQGAAEADRVAVAPPGVEERVHVVPPDLGDAPQEQVPPRPGGRAAIRRRDQLGLRLLVPDDRRLRELRPVYHVPPSAGTARGRPGPVTGSRYDPAMRLVIARCSVDYTGRLSAHLPLATRLLLVKADGSVLVHSDGGAYKPLNWMSAPCTLHQEPGAWRVTNRTGESMTIQISEILHDSSHDLGVDPGLVEDGVERHLQELLADRCTALGDGWSLVRREYSPHRFCWIAQRRSDGLSAAA